MSNPLVREAVGVANALNALRLKRHELRYVEDGVEIHQPGRPVLLLTYRAARDYACEHEGADQ